MFARLGSGSTLGIILDKLYLVPSVHKLGIGVANFPRKLGIGVANVPGNLNMCVANGHWNLGIDVANVPRKLGIGVTNFWREENSSVT